jgi:hypothetical protein
MTKRYREQLDDVEVVADAPAAFTWRGQRYRVVQVIGHWYEDEPWWRRTDGMPDRVERTDLWRVEARNGVPTRGVYEIVRRGEAWRLDRIWD